MFCSSYLLMWQIILLYFLTCVRTCIPGINPPCSWCIIFHIHGYTWVCVCLAIWFVNILLKVLQLNSCMRSASGFIFLLFLWCAKRRTEQRAEKAGWLCWDSCVHTWGWCHSSKKVAGATDSFLYIIYPRFDYFKWNLKDSKFTRGIKTYLQKKNLYEPECECI